jgi:hypothetical protein
MQLEDLLYYLHHPDKLDQLDEETLGSLVRKYPYIESIKSVYFKKFPGSVAGHQDLNEKLSDLAHSSYSDGNGQDILLPTVFDLPTAVPTAAMQEVRPVSQEEIPASSSHTSEPPVPEQSHQNSICIRSLPLYVFSSPFRFALFLIRIQKGQPIRPLLADLHDDPSSAITHTEELIKSSLDLRENIASESLANLWVSQGRPDLAIQIFEKLLAEFPEKSSTFAAKIEKLKAEYSL